MSPHVTCLLQALAHPSLSYLLRNFPLPQWEYLAFGRGANHVTFFLFMLIVVGRHAPAPGKGCHLDFQGGYKTIVSFMLTAGARRADKKKRRSHNRAATNATDPSRPRRTRSVRAGPAAAMSRVSTAEACAQFSQLISGQLSESAATRFLSAHNFNVESAANAFFADRSTPGSGISSGGNSSTPATQQQDFSQQDHRKRARLGFTEQSPPPQRQARLGFAEKAEPGWYVFRGGTFRAYDFCAALRLEVAFWSRAERVVVQAQGRSFEVSFRRDGTVVQLGIGKERVVQRICTIGGGDHAPIPYLAEARDLANLIDPQAIESLFLHPLYASARCVEDNRRAVEQLQASWLHLMAASKPLEGQNVALVGTCALGKGFLHQLVVSCGGKLPTKDKRGAERVNRNTSFLVVGILEGDADSDGAQEQVGVLNDKLAAKHAAAGSSRSSADDGGKSPIVCYTEAEFAKQLTTSSPLAKGDGASADMPRLLHELATALEAMSRQRLLLDLALESSAWRALEASEPLRGVNVALTGVFLLGRLAIGGGNSHAEAAALIKRCGGVVVDSVTKSATHLLVAGRGEKGEDGHANRKLELVETSGKWRAAKHFNESLISSGRRPIMMLYEEELLPFLLSQEARELAEDVAMEAAATEGAGPSSRRAIPPQTAAPVHLPDLRAIRFTTIAQCAHGRGEPGGKGALLADALAAPKGMSLVSALVAGQSLSEAFVWTMLQTASCADGSSTAPNVQEPELIMVRWSGGGSIDEDEDEALESVAAEDGGTGGLSGTGGSSRSEWLGGLSQLPTLGTGGVGHSRVGSRELPPGMHHRLDELVMRRRKARLAVAHSLLADAVGTDGVAHSHGRAHSKFWILRFKAMCCGCGAGATAGASEADAAVSVGSEQSVRLVISSGNALPGAYGGMPSSRQLCGLWWADFECRGSKQPPSPFRAALVDHVEGLLASRCGSGAANSSAASSEGGGATKTAALHVWRSICKAWERADTSTAEAAGTHLISHTPGTYPLPVAYTGSRAVGDGPTFSSSSSSSSSSDIGYAGGAAAEVPKGVAALHKCFTSALRHPSERLDLAVIAHSCSGWSAGGDGAERFKQWCTMAAPNGGAVSFHWPRRDAAGILTAARTSRVRPGVVDCVVPPWMAALRLVELALRTDVIAPSESTGYQATPHLMLYVLHEPMREEGEPPVIRQMLLTSANLSAAPWGYVRSERIEIRSFELGVCVAPERPMLLVEPMGPGSARAHAQALPFELTGRPMCEKPFVGRALMSGKAKGDAGHMNY